MYKLLSVLGSPKKKGNTAAFLSSIEDELSTRAEIERINISDYRINGCFGCDVCQKDISAPGCKQKDDFLQVAQYLLEADLIIYASPVYVWNFTAQLKALIDRHYCFVKYRNIENTRHLMAEKLTVLVTTCGGNINNNADLITEIYKREMDYMNAKVIGAYAIEENEIKQKGYNEKVKKIINDIDAYIK